MSIFFQALPTQKPEEPYYFPAVVAFAVPIDSADDPIPEVFQGQTPHSPGLLPVLRL
ncbi:MAG TPA: hypothetical protein VFC78_21320 [Tepidisphaeraceae bacterium]|nr:hypothetical protein [Tepidisphaeraceae bacterium]